MKKLKITRDSCKATDRYDTDTSTCAAELSRYCALCLTLCPLFAYRSHVRVPENKTPFKLASSSPHCKRNPSVPKIEREFLKKFTLHTFVAMAGTPAHSNAASTTRNSKYVRVPIPQTKDHTNAYAKPRRRRRSRRLF